MSYRQFLHVSLLHFLEVNSVPILSRCCGGTSPPHTLVHTRTRKAIRNSSSEVGVLGAEKGRDGEGQASAHRGNWGLPGWFSVWQEPHQH